MMLRDGTSPAGAAPIRRCVCLAVVSALASAGCREETASTDAPPKPRNVVMTTFYPTTWLAKELLNGAVPVECPLPADQDPIFWTPPEQVIGKYQTAALVVVNGAGFEKWVAHTSLPASRVVDSSAGLAEPFIEYENVVVHQHGPGGEHAHEGTDGHTWLDPNIAKHQATRIAAAASKTWPQHAATIEQNLSSLRQQLDELDARFRMLTTTLTGIRMFASHPAYNYVARRYEWTITNLDLDPSAPLSEQQFDSITREQQGPTILLWESEPLQSEVDRLAGAGVKSVVFSPGEQKPGAGDYADLMNRNLSQLESATRK